MVESVLEPRLHVNGGRSHCGATHWIVNVCFKAEKLISQSEFEALVENVHEYVGHECSPDLNAQQPAL